MPRLVLVDDSPTIHRIVELSFKGEGVEVRSFSDAGTALEFIEREGADVALVDVSLPFLDGYQLCRRLRENPRTAHLPVILLVGTFENLEEGRAAQAGCTGVLQKPFAPSDLVERVREQLNRCRDVPSQPAAPPGEDLQPGFLFRWEEECYPDRPAFSLQAEQLLPPFRLLAREERAAGQGSRTAADPLTQLRRDIRLHLSSFLGRVSSILI